ncbi:LysM peptidoglycan-binding domain-containing protein [Anaerosporobacter sp.]|uniref:LysM peptidoglycan-binding domain-containing protein n=1 Tax=Anaerosporobacter sp. TaxID=1872529 RepID=UPI00286F43E9|nr:LysM peptidoglycan-binding domain-containing protein [Anaerosporobacter sp.]
MRNFDRCRGVVHIIKKGDTLYGISRQYNIPLALVMRANPYADVYNLQIGDELCVPVTSRGGISNICTGNETCVIETPETPIIPVVPIIPTVPVTPSTPVMPDMTGTGLISYIIKDAETLKSILEKFDIDLEDFLGSNDMSTLLLQPGMRISIPDRRMSEEE